MNWKKNLAPALWAFGGVMALVPAVVGPVLKGKPLNYTFLAIAFMFFTFAVAAGRKPGGGSGPPSA